MRTFKTILFILIIGYFIFLIRQDIIDNLELKKKESFLMVTIKTEQGLTGRLQKELQSLKSKDYIEALARTKLGLVKKDEKAYKVFRR